MKFIEHIRHDGKPYMVRYHLLRIFGIKVNLHCFKASDPDRGLHNHPWNWAFSFILYGSYIEHLPGSNRVIKWFNRINSNTYHRVEIVTPRVWTLFIHGPRVKSWGVIEKGIFIKIENKP